MKHFPTIAKRNFTLAIFILSLAALVFASCSNSADKSQHSYSEYRVLQSEDLKDLESKTNTALKEGWLLIGGIAINPIQGVSYSQAIAK